jgi:hypothetical protein
VSGRASLTGSTTGPSRVWPKGLCHAWHDVPEVRPTHDVVPASGCHGQLTFVPGRAHARPILSCFGPAHLTQLKWPGIVPIETVLKSVNTNIEVVLVGRDYVSAKS